MRAARAISARRGLVYLSMKIPRPSGHGAAMRTGLHVRLLSEIFDVFLVVVTEEPGACEADVPPEIRERCAGVMVVQADGHRDAAQRAIWASRNEHLRLVGRALHPYPLSLGVFTARTERTIVERLRGIEFDVVQAFHVHMAPLALAIMRDRKGRDIRFVLDMDDLESDAARRRAETMRGSMGLQWYALNRLDAFKCALWERWFLRRCDQVWLSSQQDRDKARERFGADHVVWVPNGFDVPDTLQESGRGTPFTFLFVGTMSYSPNEDAAIHFCNEIFPLLRQRATSDFRVMVVGRGPTEALRSVAAQHPEVVVTGGVPEVASYYRDAHAVIAPMRLGSGTKIKILEAFSLGVPVAATPSGAAGLEAADGVHMLIAETPEAFAGACVRLMQDGELRRQLARNAYGFVSSNYGVAAIRSVIRSRYGVAASITAARPVPLVGTAPLATGR